MTESTNLICLAGAAAIVGGLVGFLVSYFLTILLDALKNRK